MKTDLSEIQHILKSLLKKHVPPLMIKIDSEHNFGVYGRKEAMQGKQKVDGYYFASVVPKPRDIRLYFFPIYTHPDTFELSTELKGYLKGKSCFHIKKISPDLELEIAAIIQSGVEIYLENNLI